MNYFSDSPSDSVRDDAEYEPSGYSATPLSSRYAERYESKYVGTVSKFMKLAQTWRDDTIDVSSITDMVTHKAYLAIIGMGERVVPLLIRELQVRPDYWFTALEAITGESPIADEDRGNLSKMTGAWLGWAQQHGYD